MSADLDKIKKATQAVYLACEASVADDISAMLKAAIVEIEASRLLLANADETIAGRWRLRHFPKGRCLDTSCSALSR